MQTILDLTDEDIRERANSTGGNPDRMVEDFTTMKAVVEQLVSTITKSATLASAAINATHGDGDALFNVNGIYLAMIDVMLDRMVANTNSLEACASLIALLPRMSERAQKCAAERMVFLIDSAVANNDKPLDS